MVTPTLVMVNTTLVVVTTSLALVVKLLSIFVCLNPKVRRVSQVYYREVAGGC